MRTPRSGHAAALVHRRRFEALWAHRSLVTRFVRARLTDRSLTDDVVAETYEVCWRKIVAGEPEANEVAWLIAVSRRMSANANRSSMRRDRLGQRITRRPQAPVDEYGTIDLRDACDRLPDVHREALALTALGYRGGALAELLGCSPNAAAIRVHRARAALSADLRSR